MLSEYSMLKQLEEFKKNGMAYFTINKDKRKVYDSKDGKYLCTIDELLEDFRKKLHCNFESVYSEHATLTEVYRCKECGCVIFSGDDEERYDPNLKCPCCSDYKCFNEYWTPEEIAADENKQKSIKDLEDLAEWQRKRYIRMKERGGLRADQIWVKKKYMTKLMYDIELRCEDFFSEYHCRLKGLRLEVNLYKRESSDSPCYTSWKRFTIPLSFHSVYIKWIFPHTKRYKELIKH